MPQASNSKQILKRIPWIDVYRGLAIILIVVGHSWSPFVGYIYLFHVPAFFFISGLSSQFAMYTPWNFFVKRLKTLIVPYFVFNLFFILAHFVLKNTSLSQILYSPADSTSFAFFTAVNGLLLFARTEEVGGATWFLPVLFSAQLFTYWLVRKKIIEKNDVVILALVTILVVTNYLFSRRWFVAYNLDLALLATFFIVIGQKYGRLLDKLTAANSVLLTFFSSILILYFGKYVGLPIDFPSRTFGPIPLVVLTSFLGIISLYTASRLIVPISYFSRILTILGKHSLWILLFHFLGFKAYHIFGYYFGFFPIETVQNLVPPPGNQHWVQISIFAIIFSLGIRLVVLHGILMTKKVFVGLKTLPRKLVNLLYQLIIIIFVAIQSHIWTLSHNHFFYADDFGYLRLSSTSNWTDFLSLIPRQMYNDRSAGQLFITSILRLLDYQYQFIHGLLLLLHIANGLLLFWLLVRLQRIWKRVPSQYALLSAVFFLAWPKSTFAVQWLSASFDLLGAFLLLMFLHSVLSLWVKYRLSLGLVYLATYLIMLRTKEVLLLAPIISSALIAERIHNSWSSQTFQKHKPLLVILGISLIFMAIYGLQLLWLAKTSEFMGFSGSSPYAVSLEPFSVIINLLRYLSLYLNIFDVHQTYQAVPLRVGIMIISVLLLFLVLVMKSAYKKQIMLLLFCSILVLAPVLPLKNMAHKLYLYIPSLFLAPAFMIVVLERWKAFHYRETYLTSIILLLLVWVNWQWFPVRSERSWWMSVGSQNFREYLQLGKIELSPNIQEVIVVNTEPTSIYAFGPGEIIKHRFQRQDIRVKLIADMAQLDATASSTLVIDATVSE